MAEPGRLMGQTASNVDMEDNDIDGEYEVDDVEYEQVTRNNSQGVHTTDVEGSDVDAEGEEVDEGEIDPVGAVKVPPAIDAAYSDEDEEQNADAATDSSADAKTSDGEDSESESEAENDWQGESDDGEEHETNQGDANVCTFCGQDEDHDPGEDYEEYLTCMDCGDGAHRLCARRADTLSSDDDASKWRCAPCTQTWNRANENDEDEEKETEATVSLTQRRLSSVPKIARDLLPSYRGTEHKGHSIFNQLILDDDAGDGSRSLRRKQRPSVETPRKKRRLSGTSRSEVDAGASVTASSPQEHAQDTVDASEGEGHASASEHGSSRFRSVRSRNPQQPKRTDKRPLVWLEDYTGPASQSLVVVFHLNNEKVQKIVTAKPRKKTYDPDEERREARRERDRERRERNRRAAQQIRADSPEVAHYPAIQPNLGAQLYSFADKDTDETKNKPYGGILSEADADTSKTYPTQVDRKRFEDARTKAEDEWKEKQAALQAAIEPMRPTKQAVPASKIKCINFGGWEIDTWHAAPYPEEYSKNRVLYICEFCLKYMNSDYVAWRHKLKCPAKHPPGDEIYHDGKYSFFEVDGRKNPVYCQNLCLLAKLFLGSKTLYYDVEPFLFYVMTENDNYGCHFVGYFSKEKRPSSQNNVSCILVLPIHMRKGYGQYLIEFSYLLTRVEKKTGSPEKPLSDMGLVSYRKYWRLVLCEELLEQKTSISITAISEKTGMTPDDIVSALEGLRALVRDPVTKSYAFRLDRSYFKEYIKKCNANDNPKIKPECLIWTPYVMGRFGQYEDGPALQTVQPREEAEDEEKPLPEEGVQQAELEAKGNGAISKNGDVATENEEVEPGTPALLADDLANGGSPGSNTPQLNGSTSAIAAPQTPVATINIPPTRYKVFPPIPGMPAPKRRPGRPFGSRRRTGTPQRSRHDSTGSVPRLQLSSGRNGGKGSPNGVHTPTASVRRTRSRLGETVINGADEEDVAEGGAVRAVNGRRSKTRSGTLSPNDIKKAKGKGKAIEPPDDEGSDDADGDFEDDADADADADGDVDPDVDADADSDDEMLDIDAEGEEDDELMGA